ncbi:MAG: ABC transporter substrate-binding protein [Rhodospirillaceae bacterium]
MVVLGVGLLSRYTVAACVAGGILVAGLGSAALADSTTLRVGHPSPAVSGAYPFARDEGGGLRYAIYDALTTFSPTGEFEPALAVSWKNETPTTWVFQLRENVVFSNGEPFNADTVVATLTELYNSEVLHARKADMGTIIGYEARSPYVVAITTTEPDPLLPNRLTQLPIIEPKAWATLGQEQYSRTPVGTGPYTLESWGPNNSNPILVVSQSSWRDVEHITRVEVTVMPDVGSRVTGLMSGELDMAVSLPSDDIATLKAMGKTVMVVPNPSILSIALRTVRTDDSPLKDARVRRALNYAVDKQSIVDLILGGTTRVAHQPSTPDLIGYNPEAEPFDYNPERAQQLLAEAGYADGFPLKFSVYGGLLPGDSLIFQKVAQDLAAIGVDVELRQISFPDYVRRLFNADWEDIDGFSIGWMNMNLWDPQKAFEQFSCAYTAPFYCDEESMPLIEAAASEMDPVKRAALLQEITLRLRDQGAALWLLEFSGVVGFQPGYSTDRFRIDGSVYENITYIEQ